MCSNVLCPDEKYILSLGHISMLSIRIYKYPPASSEILVKYTVMVMHNFLQIAKDLQTCFYVVYTSTQSHV